MAVSASANRRFLLAVGILAGGTGLSQAILFLSTPVLTRLYSPADFAVMATYTAITNIIAVSACLRFDIAVPLPEDDDDAAHVLGLALLWSFLVSALVLAIILLMPETVTSLLGNEAIGPYLLLIPAGVLAISWYNALLYWATRRKEFGRISRYKLLQAGGSAGGQITGGYLSGATAWLLLGPVLNYGLGALLLFCRSGGKVLAGLSWSRLREMFRRYSDFPKFSTLESLANSCSILLPVLIISGMAEQVEAGFLLLAMQVMQAPLSLIGTSISQVYLSTAAQEHKQGTLGQATAHVLGSLMRFGLGPLLLICLLAPEIFGLVFGAEWRRAGELVLWMTPWLALQFLASPISLALYATGNQRTALVVQLLGLLIRVGSVGLACLYWRESVAEVYAVSGAVFYGAYLLVIMRRAGVTGAGLGAEARRSAIILVPCIAIGLVLTAGVRV